jgi:hypothetical protein
MKEEEKKKLRIFYSVRYPRFGSDWADNNFYLTLVEMGHDVVRYYWDSPLSQKGSIKWSEKKKFGMNKILIEKVREADREKKVDLFFSYVNDRIAYPETIKKIKDMGIPTLNFYFDDKHEFHDIENISPAFDYCWTTVKEAVPKYKAIGANPIYTLAAANPTVYKPYPLKREFDVTFVGLCRGERPATVRKIVEAGIDIRVWGHGWIRGQPFRASIHSVFSRNGSEQFPIRRSVDKLIRDFYNYYIGWCGIKGCEIKDLRNIAGPPLPFEEMVKMYSRSKISLGFGGADTSKELEKEGRLTAVKGRDLEAPMSGAFYITEYRKELEDYYEIGKEIICYYDTEDLIEKIKYYLANEDEAEAIREAGYRRARREHTWAMRFEQVFKAMGICKK